MENDSEIGNMKIPKDCLMPKLTINMAIPAQTKKGKRKILIGDVPYVDVYYADEESPVDDNHH